MPVCIIEEEKRWNYAFCTHKGGSVLHQKCLSDPMSCREVSSSEFGRTFQHCSTSALVAECRKINERECVQMIPVYVHLLSQPKNTKISLEKV